MLTITENRFDKSSVIKTSKKRLYKNPINLDASWWGGKQRIKALISCWPLLT